MTAIVRVGMLLAAAAGLAGSTPAQAPAQDRDQTTIQRGDEVYQYWCATCHGTGPGHPGTAALTAKYTGARPGVLEERTDLTPAGIRFYVRNGVSIMPFFRKTEVSDADLDAIAAYLTRRR